MNHKPIKHARKWFENRIGKRIWLVGKSCKAGCERCATLKRDGVIVKYIGPFTIYQNDIGLDLRYTDKKP